MWLVAIVLDNAGLVNDILMGKFLLKMQQVWSVRYKLGSLMFP